MWRRIYLILILVRLYFALSPSYLHPDEYFQGPEVIAGRIFNYPVRLTWEFESSNPIRSVFPLWPVYGLPMLLLRWLWVGKKYNGEVSPRVVFWTLRVIMFVLSFVLEDWAIHELMQTPRQLKIALMLIASSYVTWTYQTHTFSNSIETLTVAWSLVLIKRIIENKKRSSTFASAILALVAVFGIFNRITFPAFLLLPGIQVFPYLLKRRVSLVVAIITALFSSLIAIFLDTSFYASHKTTWSYLLTHPVITPINNLKYNFSTANLAQHGLHPWYQHIVFNLPLLLGPVCILLFFRPEATLRLYSAVSGILILSLFKHQEARFLLPTVPLILSSVNLPKTPIYFRFWLIIWIIFNLSLGILMGVYHQGGVVPTQLFMSNQSNATHAIWWKTYPPPIWLLDGKSKNLKTHDLMGTNGLHMIAQLEKLALCQSISTNITARSKIEGTYLIAPLSAIFLDSYTSNLESLHFQEVWRFRKHLNLDDLNLIEDGFWPTIKRIVGRRGIAAWRVTKICGEIPID
ncbi:GPI mannosyltransferase [Erysiphe necator]|nr:GPI mannosyltransferase [Erysiphe necator]